MDHPDMARFTLRISRDILGKLSYIAEYNGRTKNKELEQMIKSRIKTFETKYGSIEIDQED